jgi:hypothetical protein
MFINVWKTKISCGKYRKDCGKACGKMKITVEKDGGEILKWKRGRLIRT